MELQVLSKLWISLEKYESCKLQVGRLFGRPLADLCGGDGRTELPPAVGSMLIQLHQKGPETVGIFRRGPNVRMMRDLRERLDEGEEVDWTEISVFVTAALLKDLLRSLPDCMLLSEDYSAWAEAATGYQAEKNIDSIKSLVERLPPANHHLLRHILFILNQTAENNQVILSRKLCFETFKLRNWRALVGVSEFFTPA